MTFNNRVCQKLHREHEATIALIARLDRLIAQYRENGPDPHEANAARILHETSAAIRGEVESHFAFEEDELFTYLSLIGEPAIGVLLTEEHETLRPLGVQLAALAQTGRDRHFDPGEWATFCRIGGDFCERIRAHIEKEENGLLPALEEHMDERTEARLFQLYALNR